MLVEAFADADYLSTLFSVTGPLVTGDHRVRKGYLGSPWSDRSGRDSAAIQMLSRVAERA